MASKKRTSEETDETIILPFLPFLGRFHIFISAVVISLWLSLYIGAFKAEEFDRFDCFLSNALQLDGLEIRIRLFIIAQSVFAISANLLCVTTPFIFLWLRCDGYSKVSYSNLVHACGAIGLCVFEMKNYRLTHFLFATIFILSGLSKYYYLSSFHPDNFIYWIMARFGFVYTFLFCILLPFVKDLRIVCFFQAVLVFGFLTAEIPYAWKLMNFYSKHIKLSEKIA